MISAGIVLYNPNISKLIKNLKIVIKQVDYVILIDNGSNNINEIKEAINLEFNISKIILIENINNEGIAFALNQILKCSDEMKCDWFLTLDQDSTIIEDLISRYAKYIPIDNLAMIGSFYEDINLNNLQKFDNCCEYCYVNRIITSGTLNNTRILKEIGGYDEKMFIDYVDFDICETLNEKNYLIIKCNFIGFFHEIGKSVEKNIFNKKIILYNHNSKRVYYYVRNGLYFVNKHKKNWRWNFKERNRIFRRTILILTFEKNKIENFKSMLHGIKDSKGMVKYDRKF